jgi:hypothetical protein
MAFVASDLSPVVLSVGGAAALLLAWSIISTIRQYFRLSHFKGPLSAGFSQWWLIRSVGGGRTHLDLYEVCEKYGELNGPGQGFDRQAQLHTGSIARVGPNDLITSDPDLMKRMLNVRTKYKRSDWYDGLRLDPGKDNVLSMRNDDLHGKLRSKMAAGVRNTMPLHLTSLN